MKKYLLSESGNFYKANLHCHSTVSDGKLSPEELKELYAQNGYSVIAFTDHDVMIPHHDLTDESFLALVGYEMEVNQPRPEGAPYAKTCHMCLIALSPDTKQQVCWHREKYLFGRAVGYREQVKFDETLPDYERAYTHEGISDMMQKGRDAGFFVTYNHPSWSMEEYPDYVGYNGMYAMEICNYGCTCVGYEDYVPQIYDTLLRAGKRIYCIATDDNHNHNDDSCGGFTMIKAEKLEYTAITDALVKGQFYASQGPAIEELWLEGDMVHIKCSPAREIFMNTGVRRTAFARAKAGELLTEATFKVRPEDQYFRLTVIDERGKPANTNAYFTDEWL
jgi:hypothetical protein